MTGKPSAQRKRDCKKLEKQEKKIFQVIKTTRDERKEKSRSKSSKSRKVSRKSTDEKIEVDQKLPRTQTVQEISTTKESPPLEHSETPSEARSYECSREKKDTKEGDYDYFISAIGKTDEAIEQEAISLIEISESEQHSAEETSRKSRSKSPKKPKETASRSNS